MAVTVAQCRTQVSDRPQVWPPTAQPPELIGIGDGVATIFTLRYENFIPNTLTVYTATPPASGSAKKPTWVAVSATAYTVGAPDPGPDATAATNATITFAAAPAAGVMVGARCQVTAFSDTDLAAYLARAQALYQDDLSVLKRVQYDIIDVILMDYEKLVMLAQGDYRKDASAYANALHNLKAELRLDLEGGPVAGAAVPQIAFGASVARRYQPLR